MKKYAMDIVKEQAKEIIKKFLAEIDESKLQILYPPSEIDAELSIPIFSFAKEKKQNPIQLAEDIVKNIDISKSLFSRIRPEKGYINFCINWTKFSPLVFFDYKRLQYKYGSSDIGKGKTIVIDYSSPNIAKPFSVGHLRSTVIGQALYNILKFLGYNVIGDNHIGDWGTQFGKLMCAYKKWGSKDMVEKAPIKELLNLYVHYHQEVENNEALRRELEKEARMWFKKLEDKDEEAIELWKWFKDISWRDFEKIYGLLGIKFDYVLGESFYNDVLSEIIQEAVDKGIAEWSPALEKHTEEITEEEVKPEEKVLLVRLDAYSINIPLLIQKSDGTSLYATRDLATAKYRLEKWNPEQIIYVVGGEQQLYFQQWFKVFELLGYKVKCKHAWFGMLRLPEGRMSTRKGRVIFLEDVLNEAIARAKKTLVGREISDKEKEEIARVVGIGAVKYADLSQDRTKDIIFDWEKILNLQGDSAPYIQYAYTRAQSILKKSGGDIALLANIEPALLNKKEEILLIKKIARFPEVILLSAERYEPNRVANYLFDIAQLFSKFYTEIPVLKAENESLKNTRLKLVEMIGTVLKTGLSLLGIECPAKM